MDHGSQNQPSVNSVPVGLSIQAGADAIMSLIEAERMNGAAVARNQYHKLERVFNTFRQQSVNVHIADQAQLAEARQNIQQLQDHLAQSQQTAPVMPAENTSQLAVIEPGMSQYDANALRAEISRSIAEAPDARREEALAKRQLDELQTALQRVGISFFHEANTFSFEAGWAVVLAEIGSTEGGPMNPDELHQILTNLSQRLQGDREKINQLEQQLLSSDHERQQMSENYEVALASLTNEISTLQNLAASKSSLHTDSFQSTNLFSPHPTQATASTSTSLPDKPPSGRAFLVFSFATDRHSKEVGGQSDFMEPNNSSEMAIQHEQNDRGTDELRSALMYDNGVPSAPRIDLRSMQPENRRKSHKHTPSVGLLADFLTNR